MQPFPDSIEFAKIADSAYTTTTSQGDDVTEPLPHMIKTRRRRVRLTRRRGTTQKPSIPLPTVNPTADFKAYYASEQVTQEELKRIFTEISIEDGLQLLAKMRQNCELAARTIEERRTAETLDTACKGCGITKRQMGNRNWRMVRPAYDRASGGYTTDYFCSDVCIIAENKRKHGVAAMSDRGMAVDKEALENRSKNSIIAHQEKMKQDAGLAALGKQLTAKERRAQRDMEV